MAREEGFAESYRMKPTKSDSDLDEQKEDQFNQAKEEIVGALAEVAIEDN